MKLLRILIPVLTTIILTAAAIIIMVWLTSMVPQNEWAGLIKAAIIVFVILCTLLAIAWSAYFTHVLKKSIEDK